MSKEDTLKTKEQIWSAYDYKLRNTDEFEEAIITVEDCVYDAMDEYAKQEARTEAIAFAEWCESNDWVMWDDGVWYKFEDKQRENSQTTEQLYNIFTKQK